MAAEQPTMSFNAAVPTNDGERAAFESSFRDALALTLGGSTSSTIRDRIVVSSVRLSSHPHPIPTLIRLAVWGVKASILARVDHRRQRDRQVLLQGGRRWRPRPLRAARLTADRGQRRLDGHGDDERR